MRHIQGKRGAIPEKLSPVLRRLGIQPAGYLKYIRKQENGFHHAIGTIESLKTLAGHFGQQFFKGRSFAARLYSSGG